MELEKNAPSSEDDSGQEKPKGFDLKKIDTLTVKDIQKMPEVEFLSLLQQTFDKLKPVVTNQ